MQKIIDGKLYDTGTAELLLTIIICKGVDTFVYRTPKGAYFAVESDGSFTILEEATARTLIGRRGSIETYTRLFGAPEEA